MTGYSTVRVDKTFIDVYLASGDWVLERCMRSTDPEVAALTCQRWLVDSPAKRAIFAALYGDLLRPGRKQRILDVGGGLTCFTAPLATDHDYTLVDIFAHDDAERVGRAIAGIRPEAIIGTDWAQTEFGADRDIAIANDLFPNVDQRLGPFLVRAGAACREVRISLTYYDAPRYYRVKRIDADEVLTVKAWDGEALVLELQRHLKPGPTLDALVGEIRRDVASVYPNGRAVLIAAIPSDHIR